MMIITGVIHGEKRLSSPASPTRWRASRNQYIENEITISERILRGRSRPRRHAVGKPNQPRMTKAGSSNAVYSVVAKNLAISPLLDRRAEYKIGWS